MVRSWISVAYSCASMAAFSAYKSLEDGSLQAEVVTSRRHEYRLTWNGLQENTLSHTIRLFYSIPA